uniref:Protein max n=1 Tax=Pelodiscus sinensis TaxID=13735 RepID=K7FRK5_PELSI|nr:protein max isoform X2 [Pelodiscus sinensis]|eukprot:XP_006110984.2 protein max isoform X2 [Pelodiscus sinensis]
MPPRWLICTSCSLQSRVFLVGCVPGGGAGQSVRAGPPPAPMPTLSPCTCLELPWLPLPFLLPLFLCLQQGRTAETAAPERRAAGALPARPGRRALTPVSVPLSQADKRAHHNALERKRRDHIKDSFHSLRDSVPSLQGEKASRAQILDKATEYIQYMRRKNHTHQQDIDDLKRQNALLEQQVRALEKARSSAQLQANYSSDSSLYTNPKGSAISAFDGGSDSSSESEPDEPQSRKKLRMEAS